MSFRLLAFALVIAGLAGCASAGPTAEVPCAAPASKGSAGGQCGAKSAARLWEEALAACRAYGLAPDQERFPRCVSNEYAFRSQG